MVNISLIIIQKIISKYLLRWVILCWNPEPTEERFLHMNKMLSLSINTSKLLCFYILDWSWSKTIFQIVGWKVKIKTSFNSHAVYNLSELKIWAFLFLFNSLVTVCKVRPSLGYFHGIWQKQQADPEILIWH